MLKKIFTTVFTTAAIVLGLSVINASAEDALYSDIDTYINNYPISAYAVDGKMTVIAEDLRDYGFNVDWDGEARALYISRNESVTQLTRKDIYDPKYPSGTKFSDIYESDIKVYYNGTTLISYALNGYTMIPINDLALLAGEEEWIGETRTYKVWIDGLSECEYQPLKQRSINLWYASEGREMPVLNCSEDMDSDGKAEDIVLQITGKDTYDSINTSLEIGSAHINNITDNGYTWGIEAVYLADIVPNDNAKELVIYFMCESDDPELVIYRYSNGQIQPLTFKIWEYWNSDYDYRDSFYTGYVEAYIFDLNDDNSFTLQEQSESLGMWDVYVPYKINESGIVERVQKENYPVVQNSSYGANEWGYWYVDKTLEGYGMPLYAGEWIKPIADDMNGNILIQKSNGTSGWIYRPHDNYRYFEECSRLFWMAG